MRIICRINALLPNFESSAGRLLQKGWFYVALVLLAAVGFWITQALSLELKIASSGSSPLHWIYLALDVAMAVGRAIPGLPAAIGTFEAAIVLVMHQLGFGLSEAFATAFTIHASQLVIITLVSLLVLGKNGTGLRSMIHRLKDLNGQN